jgi:NhaP-type Na+/H+ or K+/H+ antiporter
VTIQRTSRKKLKESHSYHTEFFISNRISKLFICIISFDRAAELRRESIRNQRFEDFKLIVISTIAEKVIFSRTI